MGTRSREEETCEHRGPAEEVTPDERRERRDNGIQRHSSGSSRPHPEGLRPQRRVLREDEVTSQELP
jgi:hypothetical protein